jgi:RsiW-degrading membrane proteinase PrsW (M82 family)
VAITVQPIRIGRSPDSGLLSGDPLVSEHHADLVLRDGLLHYEAQADNSLFVDGLPQRAGVLGPGQQMRIGSSYWQGVASAAPGDARKPAPAPPVNAARFLGRVADHVSAVTGVEKVEGFDAREMFSSVLEKHADEDIEEYFLVGTSTTTPALQQIRAVWPKPWVFFKTFTLTLLAYFLFYVSWNQFHAVNLLPGLIMMGSFAIPVTVLILYFELNVPRNISLFQVIRMFLVGGTLSLFLTLTVLQMASSLQLPFYASAGIMEETGKVLALLIVVNNRKYPWSLNGLLFGGAVGAGFAAFESAGYALVSLLRAGSDGVMLSTILLRALLAPGGHVVWAALNGAALWKVRGNQPFQFQMLTDARFLRVFFFTVALHAFWDFPWPTTQMLALGKWVFLIVVAWIALMSFVQDGLKQIQRAQVESRTAQTSSAVA